MSVIHPVTENFWKVEIRLFPRKLCCLYLGPSANIPSLLWVCAHRSKLRATSWNIIHQFQEVLLFWVLWQHLSFLWVCLQSFGDGFSASQPTAEGAVPLPPWDHSCSVVWLPPAPVSQHRLAASWETSNQSCNFHFAANCLEFFELTSADGNLKLPLLGTPHKQMECLLTFLWQLENLFPTSELSPFCLVLHLPSHFKTSRTTQVKQFRLFPSVHS